MRKVTVELSVIVELGVDDEAMSDWKDYNIQGAFDDEERWDVGTSEERKWLALAEEVGINGRDISNIDGWADFPSGAVTQASWPYFDVLSVY